MFGTTEFVTNAIITTTMDKAMALLVADHIVSDPDHLSDIAESMANNIFDGLPQMGNGMTMTKLCNVATEIAIALQDRGWEPEACINQTIEFLGLLDVALAMVASERDRA